MRQCGLLTLFAWCAKILHNERLLDNPVRFAEHRESEASQSRLSQLENSSKGMTPELLEKYAGFFELGDGDRLEFYLTAYGALSEVTLNLEKIHPDLKIALMRILSAFMADSKIVDYIQQHKDGKSGFEINSHIQPWNNIKNSVVDWINDIYKS